MIDNFGYESTKGLTLVIEKHQDHDQSSHGNWATGGGAKTPKNVDANKKSLLSNYTIILKHFQA